MTTTAAQSIKLNLMCGRMVLGLRLQRKGSGRVPRRYHESDGDDCQDGDECEIAHVDNSKVVQPSCL